MDETSIYPPRTIMQVFRMLPEGTLAEVIDNTLYMSPTPIGRHQRVLRKLIVQMDNLITERKLGELFFVPFDVFLDENSNAVQPDILFISKENSHIVSDDGYVHGVPDLIIEVLSPGNKKHDTVKKKLLYEKFGVKEYWTVDPENNQCVGYTLKNNTYALIGEYTGVVKSTLLSSDFNF